MRTLAILILGMLGSSATSEAKEPLRVALWGNYMPLHGESGEEKVGFEADLARALAKEMGRELVFAERTGKGSLASVQEGLVDVSLNSITPTEERRKLVDFSRSYLQVAYRLAGKQGARVYGPAEMQGKKVAVPKGPTLKIARRNLDMCKIIETRSTRAAIKLVQKGKANFLLGEDVGLLHALPSDLALVGPVVGWSELAMAVPKGKVAPFDLALRELEKKGVLKRLKRFWKPGQSELMDAEVVRTVSGMQAKLPSRLAGAQRRGRSAYLRTSCGRIEKRWQMSFALNREGRLHLNARSEGCKEAVEDTIVQLAKADGDRIHLLGEKNTYTLTYPYSWSGLSGLRFVDHCADANAWIPIENQDQIPHEEKYKRECHSSAGAKVQRPSTPGIGTRDGSKLKLLKCSHTIESRHSKKTMPALFDGDPETSVDLGSHPQNSDIKLVFPETVRIFSLRIANGNQARSKDKDLLASNGRLKKAVVLFSDFSSTELNFKEYERGFEEFSVDGALTDSLTIDIKSIYEVRGARTAVSEIEILGQVVSPRRQAAPLAGLDLPSLLEADQLPQRSLREIGLMRGAIKAKYGHPPTHAWVLDYARANPWPTARDPQDLPAKASEKLARIDSYLDQMDKEELKRREQVLLGTDYQAKYGPVRRYKGASTDGSVVATGHSTDLFDGTAFFRSSDGNLEAELPKSDVKWLVFSPDNKTVYVISWKKGIRALSYPGFDQLWENTSGEVWQMRHLAAKGRLRALVKRGTQLFVTDMDAATGKTLIERELAIGSEDGVTEKDLDYVSSFQNRASFSDDGSLVAATLTHPLLKIWDVETGKSVWSRAVHKHQTVIAFGRGDQRHLLFAFLGDQKFSVIDAASDFAERKMRTKESLSPNELLPLGGNRLMCKSGFRIALLSVDKFETIWELRARDVHRGSEAQPTQFQFAGVVPLPEDRLLVLATYDGRKLPAEAFTLWRRSKRRKLPSWPSLQAKQKQALLEQALLRTKMRKSLPEHLAEFLEERFPRETYPDDRRLPRRERGFLDKLPTDWVEVTYDNFKDRFVVPTYPNARTRRLRITTFKGRPTLEIELGQEDLRATILGVNHWPSENRIQLFLSGQVIVSVYLDGNGDGIYNWSVDAGGSLGNFGGRLATPKAARKLRRVRQR